LKGSSISISFGSLIVAIYFPPTNPVVNDIFKTHFQGCAFRFSGVCFSKNPANPKT